MYGIIDINQMPWRDPDTLQCVPLIMTRLNRLFTVIVSVCKSLLERGLGYESEKKDIL
mgnify:CR=1 FL=1